MKFAAFNGSPAGERSATGRMLRAFLDGAGRAGAEIELYHLGDYSIEQCRGCFACWFRTPGQCVKHDDMAKLLDAYRSADVVCFGSPVYSWNMTALLKNFVDRLIPLKSPLLTEKNGRYDMADAELRRQKFVTVSNCGFPGENNFAIIRATFSCCAPSLEIYRNCGRLLVSEQESVQETVRGYLQSVEQAGCEFAVRGEITEETRARLDAPLMSDAEYTKFLGM